MSKLTDKIARLLALADSPYEAEAQAALLKARQLMAEHKLRPEDIAPEETQRLRREGISLWSTKLSTPWAARLASVIAEHYCCKSYLLRAKRSKTSEIALAGLEEDFLVCKRILQYAYTYVLGRCREIRKQSGYSVPELRSMCDSYGWGFCSGLQDAFCRQSAEHQEWGLVLVTPKAVQDTVRGMKAISYGSPSQTRWHSGYGNLGYSEGQKFDPAHSLTPSTRKNGLKAG